MLYLRLHLENRPHKPVIYASKMSNIKLPKRTKPWGVYFSFEHEVVQLSSADSKSPRIKSPSLHVSSEDKISRYFLGVDWHFINL